MWAQDTTSQTTMVPFTPDTTKDIIVDDGTVGFWTDGYWSFSISQPGFWGRGYLSHEKGSGSAKAYWVPVIRQAGDYEIYISYTPHSNRASNASYLIQYAGGTTTRIVNQKLDTGNYWVSLGTYPFSTDTSGIITLTDRADGYVIADAMVFRMVKETKSPVNSPKK